MAITYVDGNGNFGGVATSATGPLNTATAGNLLICEIGVRAASSGFSVTPSGWNKIGEMSQAGFAVAWAWRIATADANDTPSWSWSTSGSWECAVYEYTGNTSSPVGNTSTNSGNSTTVTGTAVTAVAAGSWIIFMMMCNGAKTVTFPSSPWTIVSNANGSGDTFSTNVAGNQLTNAGDSSGTPTFTYTGSTQWACLMVEIMSQSPTTPRTFGGVLW